MGRSAVKPPPTIQDPSGIFRLQARNPRGPPAAHRIVRRIGPSQRSGGLDQIGPPCPAWRWRPRAAPRRRSPPTPCSVAGTSPQGEPAQPADDPGGHAGRPAAHGVLPAAGHRGQRPGCAHPVPGTAGLAPPASPLTDALAAEALRRAAAGLRAVYAARGPGDAADLAARGLLGGMLLANAKLGAGHSLARVVGGIAHVPYGIACPRCSHPSSRPTCGRCGPGRPAVDRYDRAARLLTGQPAASIRDGRA